MDRKPMTRREKADWIFLWFAVAFFAMLLLYSTAESPLLGMIHGPACICRERSLLLDAYGNPIKVRFEGKLHRLDKIYELKERSKK